MVSPIDIQQGLSGTDHPAGKDDSAAHAQRNGGDGEVLESLRTIEDREHEGPSGAGSAVFD